LSPKPPSQTFFAELYDQFTLAERWQVLPDVIPALEALASAGVRMAVVSNWDERLRTVLKAVKLHDYFETIIASHDIGFTKPSSVIFEQAAKKLGVPPGGILHVGDHPREDVEGAQAAGFQSVLLDRTALPIPNQRIASLDAVLGYFPGA
jgi:putative hydrolase of the HAD superfamily